MEPRVADVMWEMLVNAGIVPFGVDFKNPNFAKVAEAMGAKGIRIEEPGDVKEGLASHIEKRKPNFPPAPAI